MKKLTLHSYIANTIDIQNVYVDHINHDTLDNRKCNLRIINNSNNTKNRKGRNSNNTTGYRNVMYIKTNTRHPYVVKLQIDGKSVQLGSFADVDEAGAFAEEMRGKFYGEFKGKN